MHGDSDPTDILPFNSDTSIRDRLSRRSFMERGTLRILSYGGV